VSEISEPVRQFLVALGEDFAEFAEKLRLNKEVRTVTAGAEERSYDTGKRFECFADAELNGGNAVSFWLEFYREPDLWKVDSSVRHITVAGSDEIVGLPTRCALDDADLVSETQRASKMLFRSAEQLDFLAL
jgi:hypothetical protein